MKEYIEQYSSKNKLISKVNPKMISYSEKLTLLHDRYIETHDPSILKEIRALRLERNKLPSRIRIGNRVNYVRYADD